MYGIYANIGGILMVNITIYIAYMDPMGLVPSCPVTWNTRRSVVTSSSRVVFPSVILAYVSSQIICVVAARLLQCFVGMSGSIFIQQFSISIKKQSKQFSMFLNSLHFHPPLEARGLELYHLPDQIKELLYAANLLPSFLCFFSPVIEVSKKKTKKHKHL